MISSTPAPSNNPRRTRWPLLYLVSFAFALTTLDVAVRPDAGTAMAALHRQDRLSVGLESAAVVLVVSSLLASLPVRIGGWRRSAGVAVLASLLLLGGLLQRFQAREREMASAPHVLLITLDGLSASHLMRYGSPRNTMPFLEALAAGSLVAENFFPQACCTAPGLTSLTTGRSPLELGIFYPPHQLAVESQYLGLPTLLLSRGFRTVQFTEDRYSDANALQLRGFERVNGSNPEVSRNFPAWSQPHRWVIARVLARFGWSSGEEIALAEPAWGFYPVRDKLAELVEELRWAERPIFAQVHLMESHGPDFNPSSRRFSAGQRQDKPWMDDFYDDVLGDLDRELSNFFEAIGRLGLGNKIVVAITTDHGKAWNAAERIPFILYGRGITPRAVRINTQPIDVAPSLLTLLGFKVPVWMSGRSLIGSRSPDPWRLILATSIYQQSPIGKGERWEIRPMTPNRGLARVDATICDQQFSLDLRTGVMTDKPLGGATVPCPKAAVPAPAFLRVRLLDYLRGLGYTPVATRLEKTK